MRTKERKDDERSPRLHYPPPPPQTMQTPVPLHVLHELTPEPKALPVPLQLVQRPDPRHELHWFCPLLPGDWSPPDET